MKKALMKKEQIAPCGANCVLCMAYLRSRKNCRGCRFGDENKSNSCINCEIKNCREIRDHDLKYCFECSKYPCKRLSDLDARYRKNYAYSMLDSLNCIKNSGIKRFLIIEKEKWECKKCGGTICVHRGYCCECGEIRYKISANGRPQIK